MKLQVYPATSVKWPDPADAPGDISEFDRAHVTINGNRMTIRSSNGGRAETVDTLTDITVKGRGKDTTVTGRSRFMIDMVGVPPEDADVTVHFDASPSKCLTNDA